MSKYKSKVIFDKNLEPAFKGCKTARQHAKRFAEMTKADGRDTLVKKHKNGDYVVFIGAKKRA
jgi:hypothetical protein